MKRGDDRQTFEVYAESLAEWRNARTAPAQRRIMTNNYKSASGDYVAYCSRKGCGWYIDGLDAYGSAYEETCHRDYHEAVEMFLYADVAHDATTLAWSERVAKRRPLNNRFMSN